MNMKEKRPNQFTNPWTDNKIEILKEMVGEGFSDQEIADVLERSKKSVQVKKSRLGLAQKEDPYLKFKDASWLRHKYHMEGLSLPDIAKIAGVHNSAIGRWMEKSGIERRGFHEKSKRHKMKIGLRSKERTGEMHHSWKGGKTKTNEGYVYVIQPNHPCTNANGAVLEHRLVMERIIGRYLRPEEIVHHINEKKDDNRPENLFLFSSSKWHTYYHMMIRTNRKVELQYEY
jgi:hypothetical protein